MNPQLAAKLAAVYVNGEHQPEHLSYRAFVAETLVQFNAIPVEVKFIDGTLTGTSEDLFTGCDCGILCIAVDGSPFAQYHPMNMFASASSIWTNEVYVNSAFRAVHDYYGHYLTRSPFETIDGELAAYKAHASRYSPEAQLALFSETILQLAYHTHYDEFVPVQKCVINPEALALFQSNQ